jgi:hypothetical protein
MLRHMVVLHIKHTETITYHFVAAVICFRKIFGLNLSIVASYC